MKHGQLASKIMMGVIFGFLFLELGTGCAAANSISEKLAELNNRVAYWKSEDHLPYCNWDYGTKFPSKYQDAAGPDNETLKCNDGDSVGFNGLLCASGDSEGCDAVRRSQQPKGSGRWWRSPKRLYEGAEEGGTETTFSNDHALGVWAYIAQTKDKDAFRRWIDWIDNNPRCGASLKCIPLFPRYCADDRCTFKLIDCPLLDRLALRLNESNPICDPLHNFANAAIAALYDFQRQYDDIIGNIYKIPGSQLLKPEIEALRTPFNDAINVLREAIKSSEALRERMATYARATSGADGLATLVNSMFNDPGYALDDVAYAIFNLRKYGGFNNSALSSAAEILVSREKENAFFEYVAHGPTEKMLDQILAKCPSRDNDVPHARYQWTWQRDDNEQPPPWKKTMYWDCIFVANLYEDGPLSSGAKCNPRRHRSGSIFPSRRAVFVPWKPSRRPAFGMGNPAFR